MGCIWFVIRGQSQAFQRAYQCAKCSQFEKASRYFHILQVTVSHSLPLTHVLAMCLFIYANSSHCSGHNCCFRVVHIAKRFWIRYRDVTHRQLATVQKAGGKKVEKIKGIHPIVFIPRGSNLISKQWTGM